MQQKTFTRDSNRLSFAVTFTQPVVKAVKRDGDRITVNYTGQLRQIEATAVICERLANAESDEQIIAFTREYGQLTHKGTDGGVPRDNTFTLESFKKMRQWIRAYWQIISNEVRAAVPCTSLLVEAGEQFHFGKEGVTYEAKNLSRLIELFLASLPPDHLKVCLNTETCQRPYIVNSDARVKQCGDEECRQWVHRQASKAYRANGPKRAKGVA